MSKEGRLNRIFGVGGMGSKCGGDPASQKFPEVPRPLLKNFSACKLFLTVDSKSNAEVHEKFLRNTK